MMKVEVRVVATANERRRFLGGADITPMVELVSEMLDDVMMLFVEARLAAIDEAEADVDPSSVQRDGEPVSLPRRSAS